MKKQLSQIVMIEIYCCHAMLYFQSYVNNIFIIFKNLLKKIKQVNLTDKT